MATVIPVDASVFAESLAITGRIGLSSQDALIYAAVLAHLRTGIHPGPHFFISKNWKDFSDPRIETDLAQWNCEFLSSFDEGTLRLEQPLPD
ncbi:MAG: hypothetical protein H0T18_06000 [Chloroflexia bacterium]|nr:hypothetical protein [Chloroflexia bacterium]